MKYRYSDPPYEPGSAARLMEPSLCKRADVYRKSGNVGLERFAFMVGTILEVPGLVPGYQDGYSWCSIIVDDLRTWHEVENRESWARDHRAEIARILVFDAVIGNGDRHASNIGIDSEDRPVVFDHDCVLLKRSPAGGFHRNVRDAQVEEYVLQELMIARERITPSTIRPFWPAMESFTWPDIRSPEELLDWPRIVTNIQEHIPASAGPALEDWLHRALRGENWMAGA